MGVRGKVAAQLLRLLQTPAEIFFKVCFTGGGIFQTRPRNVFVFFCVFFLFCFNLCVLERGESCFHNFSRL